MSRAAPIVLAARALAVDWVRQVRDWPVGAQRLVGEPLVAAALDLLVHVERAAWAPARRGEVLAEADAALVRLRALGAVAAELALPTAAARLDLAAAADALGRMLGGWLQAVRRNAKKQGPSPRARTA